MDISNKVQCALNGDPEAVNDLYYSTYTKVRNVAFGILKNESDVDDVVQESYIKAFSNLKQLESPEKFESWLSRIVANKCKDYIKKNKPLLFSDYENDSDEPIEWDIEDDSKEYNPEEVLISSDTRNQLLQLLNSLPDEQRICFIYYAVDGMKIAEIAEMLDVPVGTVKSRINYAKSKMKAKINELEKKGVKLRGFAGFALLPFIRQLFSSETVSVPPISPEILSSSVVGAAETTAAISETVASTSSAVVGETAKSVVGHTIKHIGLKIISGIVAGIVTIATVATVITNVVQKEPTSTDSTPLTSGESGNIISNLSGQELADLNEYLSCFSEQRFSQFPCDDESLYSFAYIYNKLNTNNLYTDNGTVFDYANCIEKNIIDGTIKKFFNTQIGEISTDFVSLKDGVYYNVAADGETYPYLSIARQLYKESDDTYRVIFDVYEVLNLNGAPIPSYYFALDAVSADINSWMSRQIGGVAIITKVNLDDFYIKEYKENEDVQRDQELSSKAKIIPEGCSYYISRSQTYLHAGDTFPDPSGGDIYKDSVYEYHYKEHLGPDDPNDINFTDGWEQWQWHGSQNGWGVRVIDDSLATYADIPIAIAGRPVLNLDYTFALCSNIIESPKIPATVISMAYTFYGCEKMEEADIVIPAGVKNLEATFMWCSKLTGEIEIKAIPETYDFCFYRTAGPIVLCGKQQLDVYNSIINTAANNAVVWKNK